MDQKQGGGGIIFIISYFSSYHHSAQRLNTQHDSNGKLKTPSILPLDKEVLRCIL